MTLEQDRTQAAATEPVTQRLAQMDDATIKALDEKHVFRSWSTQGGPAPAAIVGGEGSHVWGADGVKYLDFTSQLVNMNIGYGHPKVVAAIAAQAHRLTMASPAVSNDARSECARMIAELAPEGMSSVFFTNGGAEANENALRMARIYTGRNKVLSSYRSYHGATGNAVILTGEKRRFGSEPGGQGIVHFWGPYQYRSSFHAQDEEQECERALAHLRETVVAENPDSIAAIFLEPVVGSAGLIVPPAGYLKGVREICDEFGILFVADEVMAGFARTGAWFAFEHWGVRPDLISFAKGSNSGYVPLGGVIVDDRIRDFFRDRPYPGGLTYQGHALACAAAIASIEAMRDEKIVENARALGDDVFGPGLKALQDKYDCIGDVRGLGAFWAMEFVEDRGTKAPMATAKIGAAAKERGLWPMAPENRIHIVPPCTTTPDEAREGLRILDEAIGSVVG